MEHVAPPEGADFLCDMADATYREASDASGAGLEDDLDTDEVGPLRSRGRATALVVRQDLENNCSAEDAVESEQKGAGGGTEAAATGPGVSKGGAGATGTPRSKPACAAAVARKDGGSKPRGAGDSKAAAMRPGAVLEDDISENGCAFMPARPCLQSPCSTSASGSLELRQPADEAPRAAAGQKRKQTQILDEEEESLGDGGGGGGEDEREQEDEGERLAGDVLDKVEAISQQLRSALEVHAHESTVGPASSGRQGDGAAASQCLVQPSLLQRRSVCGAAARLLKPYQIAGINFFLLLYRNGIGGGMLGDEMGLGKTAQTISFLAALAAMEGDSGPHMVVCPSSLLENWQREFETWAPRLRVVAYWGAERATLRRALNRYQQQAISAAVKARLRSEARGEACAMQECGPEPDAADGPTHAGEATHAQLPGRLRRGSEMEGRPAHGGGIASRLVDEEDEEEADADSASDEEEEEEEEVIAETSSEEEAASASDSESDEEGEAGGEAAGKLGGSGWKLPRGLCSEAILGAIRSGTQRDPEPKASSFCAEEAEEAARELGLRHLDPRRARKLPFDVLLTSYTVFEGDALPSRQDRAFLLSWGWSHVVLDEAHAVKNRATRRAKNLHRLAALARHRIMLTGTPLQNDLEELMHLLIMLVPDVFPALQQRCSQDSRQLADILAAAGAARRPGELAGRAALVEWVRAVLDPFLLRRLKRDVAQQLPAKTHLDEFLPMLPGQAQLYEQAVLSLSKRVQLQQQQQADGPQRKKPRMLRGLGCGDEDGAARRAAVARLGRKEIASVFTHLRKIALHPLLVRHSISDAQLRRMAALAAEAQVFGPDAREDRVREELEGMSDHQLHQLAQDNPGVLGEFRLAEDAVLQSAKFRHLQRLLPELRRQGSKVLLFSQWTLVLDLMEWLLDQLQLSFLRLDGDTAVNRRLELVDTFNAPQSPHFAFLLSTRAGGQGLNLTAADHVVLHDVDFNPSIDQQAEDRTHRIGQTKLVTVHRLVMKDTVDENIFRIAERKRKLNEAVFKEKSAGHDASVASGCSGGRAEAVDVDTMGDILAALLSKPATS